MKRTLTFLSIYLIQLFVCFSVFTQTLELTPRINFYEQNKIPPKFIKNQISKIEKSNNILNFNGAKVISNVSAIGSQIDLSWGRYFSSSYSDRIYKTVIDANDNVICVGTKGYGTNDIDGVIYKYDKSGNLLWSKSPASSSGSDEIYDVSTDDTGNVFITGRFYSSAFEGQIQSNGEYDIFIAKYSPDGTLLWAKNAGGSGYDYSSGIALDQTGNVYVVGFFNGSASWDGISKASSAQGDMFIAKYNNNGKILWVRNGDIGEDGYLYGIDTDKSGNVYVSSNLSGETHFEGAPIVSTTGANDMFLIKYDTSGNFVWIKTAGGIGDDGGNDVKIDSDGNILVAGYFRDNAKFDNTILTAHGSFDIFAAKYSPTGKLIWVKQFGGTGSQTAWAVNSDEKNNCYLTGWFSGTGAFDNTTIVSTGDADAYIIKYDKNGNLIWVEPTATGLDKQVCQSVFVKANNLAISGYYLGEMNIQGGIFPNSGGEDGYLAMLTQSDVTAPAIFINPGLTISASQIKAGQSITFSGKQFNPVGKVDLYFSGTGAINPVIDYAIDVNGNFQYTLPTLTSQKIGEYVVTATDKISGKSASRTFQVLNSNENQIDNNLIITEPNSSKPRYVNEPILFAWEDVVKYNVNPLYNMKHCYTVSVQKDGGEWMLVKKVEGYNIGIGKIYLSTVSNPGEAGKYIFKVEDNYYPNRIKITPEIIVKNPVSQNINIEYKWDRSYPLPANMFNPVGVAADGIARFYMVITNPNNLTINKIQVRLKDYDNLTNESKYLGKVKYCNVRSNENFSTDADDAVDIMAENNVLYPNGEYWFWYVAPENFARENSNDSNKGSRIVLAVFDVTLSNGSKFTQEKEIEIVRPPVLLVHGLNDYPSTWDKFRIGTSNPIYFDEINPENGRFKVIKALAMLGKSHFDDNANLLLASIDDTPDNRSFEYNINQIREKGYACNQVDYICHSMGGSMLRTAADKESLFKRIRNYNKGFVHKFITLNTPHQGSSLANFLQEGEGIPIFNLPVVNEFYNKGLFPTIIDAVSDLRYIGGVKFNNLNIRSHLIGGGSSCDILTDNFNHLKLSTAYTFLKKNIALSHLELDIWSDNCNWYDNHFEIKGYETDFMSGSDGIVSLTSQFNGENVYNNTSYCTKVNEALVHTSALGSPYPTGNDEVFNKVNILLNTNIDSNAFGFLSSTGTNDAGGGGGGSWVPTISKTNTLKYSIDDTKLKVIYPIENQQYNSEDTMAIKIKVDTVGLKQITVYFQDQIISTMPSDTILLINLTVNPDYIEEQTLNAVGIYQIADQWSRSIYTTNIMVNPKGSIIDFKIKPELMVIQKGYSDKPIYEAVFPGSISEISKTNLFTVAITDSTIVSYVDSTSTFEGLAEGITNAIITYRGISKTVFFEVLDPKEPIVNNPSGLENIISSKDLLAVKTYPNPFSENITFEFTLPKSDNTKLEVYNLSGIKVKEFDFGIQSAGLFKKNVDMEGLSTGVYIYKLTSGNSILSGNVVKM